MTTAEQYLALSQMSFNASHDLPHGTIAERYHALLSDKYAQMSEHRATFARLFAQSLEEETSDFSRISGTSDPMHSAIAIAIDHASDSLTDEMRDAFLSVLYVFYILLVLFWLYDRTPQHQASTYLLNFMREVIKLLRPMLFVPMFANAMRRFSAISALVFGTNINEER